MNGYYYTNVPKEEAQTLRDGFWVWKEEFKKDCDYKVMVINYNRIISKGSYSHIFIDDENILYV